jgi:hypothetical protein
MPVTPLTTLVEVVGGDHRQRVDEFNASADDEVRPEFHGRSASFR